MQDQQRRAQFPKCYRQLEELQAALADAGISLPGLTLHEASFQDGMDGIPLFRLGLCNLINAKRLTEVLRKGAT